jgi:HSP20 family molecular chaperone IbpA
MTAMRMVGNGHLLPPHAHVRETAEEYVVELDVSDFTESEIQVEIVGPEVTVRGDQLETKEDEGLAFRLHERLEECFRLPDDADADRLNAFYAHGTLELHAPHKRLEPREVPLERKPVHLINPEATPC